MRLRVDPWDPGYGASVDAEPEPASPAGLELAVETDGPWHPIASEPHDGLPCCAFIDGVRRIDARLFAEENGSSAPALAGSWAVGAAWSTRPPKISDITTGRTLVVGAGLSASPLTTRIGGQPLTFAHASVTGESPDDVLYGLQNAMRTAEADLARAILESGRGDLVVSDGPLSYLVAGPAVGMTKRQSRHYLDPERARVLPRLQPGERSPIFKLGAQRLERYTWYLRLAPTRPIDGSLAGIVRLEVAAAGGLDTARQLAALTAAVLPRFAPAPGRDPRAPQNLYPISALESVLKHRLADPALVRRSIEQRIHMEVLDGH